MKRALVSAAALAAAALMGYLAAPARTVTAPTGNAAAACEKPLDRALLRAEIREAVAEAMAPLQRATPVVAVAAKVEPAPPRERPSAEPSEAFERGQSMVEAALASRRWTEDDAEALRPLFATMSDDERQQIARAILPAVNRGELAVELRGPLF